MYSFPIRQECKYQVQLEKGKHELMKLSEDQCLAKLHKSITDFRTCCSDNQRKILQQYWSKGTTDKQRIGVLKLVLKVHKLQQPIHSESWKVLPSRPIRGAETDPMKTPSTALYRMISEVLEKFKTQFPSVSEDQDINFTVLRGCDYYI